MQPGRTSPRSLLPARNTNSKRLQNLKGENGLLSLEKYSVRTPELLVCLRKVKAAETVGKDLNGTMRTKKQREEENYLRENTTCEGGQQQRFVARKQSASDPTTKNLS